MPPVGARIGGRYRIAEAIGRGGMGSVFRVIDEPSGKALALKLLGGARELRDTKAATLRFQREFHTVARLRHPRVVEVYDYGVDPAGPFYTMEHIDGKDLREIGPTDPGQACRLLRDVASALSFLHDRRLLHRDLGGRNVRITGQGRAKLIDFGVLATFGFSGEVAGTPPCVAPESLLGLPLDHRVDLFGLGTLAYWLLTGRHAFPARTLAELEPLWRVRPEPPSRSQREVPPDLDQLIMSLLSIDPLGRPTSAAEVIARLTAIGHLDPLAEPETVRGYLASAALVGRGREMRKLKQLLGGLAEGRGSSVVVEAASGVGKSRLLQELGFEAQMSGAALLRARSEDIGYWPYGLVRALAGELIALMPAEAAAHARPLADTLVRVVPDLVRTLGPVELAPPGGPAEERMRAQTALVDWFLAVSRGRPLVIVIDDIQRCDEVSAAVLAALAHAAASAPLLLAAALRTDETVRAPAAVAALRDAGARLRLRGLDEDEVVELVRGLLGTVQNAGRLASWMNRVAGGVPLHLTELTRSLVDSGTVRFVEAVWVVPEDVAIRDLPVGLQEAMDARIGGLSPAARALGEALSVYGGAFSLHEVAAVAESSDADQLFAALDELVFEEVLVGSEHYRFRHDGLREALLRRLDPERMRVLHLRAAQALAAITPVDPSREAEIGWHLVAGGERERGADLLARAGESFHLSQAFADAIQPLETALEVYQERRSGRRRQLELHLMLLVAGTMVDREVAMRHIEAPLTGFGRDAGMSLARRISPILGRPAALVLGMTSAAVRWLLSFGRRPSPAKAMPSFFVTASYATAIFTPSFDLAGAKAIEEKLDPIAALKGKIPYAAVLFTRMMIAFLEGHMAELRPLASEILDIVARDKKTKVSDYDRKMLEATTVFWPAFMMLLEHDPGFRADMERLEALNLRIFSVSVKHAHALYHRLRGEEDRAAEFDAEIELLTVRLGTMWQIQSYVPIFSSIAYGFNGDVVGLRRTVERLSAMVASGFQVAPFLELARGEYHRLSGDLDESEAALRRAQQDPARGLAWMLAPAALAETLLTAGRIGEAATAAREAIAINSEPARRLGAFRLRAERTLALAETAGGDAGAGAARLDRALAEAALTSSPALLGALHEARALVALAAGDVTAFQRHSVDTDQWFRSTRNPALIARAQRLADNGARQPVKAGAPLQVDRVFTVAAASRPSLGHVLRDCRGPTERAQRALEFLLSVSAAADGYLYRCAPDRSPRLVASSTDADPPHIVHAVKVAVAAWDPEDGEPPTELDVAGPGSPPRVFILAGAVNGEPMVGAAVLTVGALPFVAPPPELLREVAAAMAATDSSSDLD